MPDSGELLDSMVEEIFGLFKLVASARSRRDSSTGDLSETEFLALDVLSRSAPLSIGEVQKVVGVVPAQMSRVVRALEVEGGRGYVECKINPQDRRRIDLSLTESGRKAYEAYRRSRLGSFYTVLEALDPDDRADFMRMLKRIRKAFETAIELG